MENTCRNFWKMIVDKNVSVVIMLSQLEENGEVSFHLINKLNNYYYRKYVISIGHHLLNQLLLESLL